MPEQQLATIKVFCYRTTKTKDDTDFKLTEKLDMFHFAHEDSLKSEIKLHDALVVRTEKFKTEGTALYLHLTSYIPGESMAAIKTKQKNDAPEETETNAPDGFEYKDGEAFLCCMDHNFVLLTHGLNYSKCIKYLKTAIAKTSTTKSDVSFSTFPVLNKDKANTIRREKVKRIRMNAATNKMELPAESKNNWVVKSFNALADLVVDKLRNETPKDKVDELSTLNVAVEVSIPDGFSTSSDDTALSNIAVQMTDDNDLPLEGVTILTQEGTSINTRDLKIHKRLSVKKNNKFLNRVDVWNELGAYMLSLYEQNILK